MQGGNRRCAHEFSRINKPAPVVIIVSGCRSTIPNLAIDRPIYRVTKRAHARTTYAFGEERGGEGEGKCSVRLSKRVYIYDLCVSCEMVVPSFQRRFYFIFDIRCFIQLFNLIVIDLDRGDFYARGVKKVMISRFLDRKSVV